MADQDATYLTELRKRLGQTQAEMASWMDVPYRTYQAIENGKNPVRPIHIKAARMAALQIASDRLDIDILPTDLKAFVLELAATHK